MSEWKIMPGTYENGKQLKIVGPGTAYVLVGGDNKEANASLLVAAPELLQAAKSAVAILSQNKTYPADVKYAKTTLMDASATVEAGEKE